MHLFKPNKRCFYPWVLLAFLLSWTQVAWSQSNECATATVITPGATCVTTNGTNVGATQSIAPITCAGFTSSSALDVWYQFTASATSHAITVNATFDAIIDVRSGACPGTNIGCADGNTSTGVESVTVGSLTVGTTYFIRVYGWAGATGTFTICVAGAPAAPANDNCAAATTLTPGATCVTTNGTNVGATQSIAPITCNFGTSTSALDVWYQFTATGTSHTITVAGALDVVVDVRSGACNGTNIGCADAFGTNGTEVVTVGGLTVGSTYFVRVYGWNGTTGTFTICVTNPPAAPSNDNCANATSLTPSPSCVTTNGTTVNATQSIPAETCNGFTGTADDDVWYSFVATSTSHTVTVNAVFDAVVELRSGACNGTKITCADNNLSTGVETFTQGGLTIGTTYLIRVYSWQSGAANTGTFTICVTSAPANDNCASATTLTPGTTCVATSGTSIGATQSVAPGTCSGFTSSSALDVWYQFTATSPNHNVTVVGGAGFDPIVDARSGACDGTSIGCVDATAGGGSTETLTLTGLTIGTVYRVRVYGWAGATGTFTICVTTPPPPNDNCAAAITLTPAASCSPTSGFSAGATQSVAPSTCSGFTSSAANDVWYQFTATSPNHTVTVVGGTGFDPVVEARSGACNGTAISCVDATTGAGTENLVLTNLTVGTVYLVRVYGWAGNTGSFTICVTTQPPNCIANPTSPANGANLCPNQAITLSWPAAPGATGYDVYFGTTNAPPLVSSNQAGTTYTTGVLPAGTYFWQVRPRNAGGAAAGCTVWTFTLSDTQAPALVCPANITVNNALNQCGANVTFPTIVATDNCGTVTVTTSIPSGSFFNVGTTTVTVTAKDGSNNMSMCNFTVTVNDVQPPTVTCPANITTNNAPNQCGANVTFAAATASDNCSIASNTPSIASGSFFPVGTTTVTVTVKDPANNMAMCTFTVTVNDVQLPVITCPAPQTLPNQVGLCGAVATFANATATDNCPGITVSQTGGLTSGSFFPVGNNTVTFKATDAANNMASCSFIIKVNDVEAPKITCPPAVEVGTTGYTCEATNVNLGNAVPTDNCGVVTLTNNAPTVFPIGNTSVVYQTADAAGNSASCTQIVTVVDLQLPVVECPTSPVLATADGANGCTAVVDYTVNAYDNCPGVTVTSNYPPLSEFPVDYTTVIVTATDAGGNTNFCAFQVFVGRAAEICNDIDDDCDGQVDESDDWTNAGRRLASDGVAGEQYGSAIDIDGDFAIVGAKDKDAGGQTVGGAYILYRDGDGNWQQLTKLVPQGLDAGDDFGAAVAIDGSWLAVGAPGDNDVANNAGAVYLYQQDAVNPTQWNQLMKIMLPNGNAGDAFGAGLALWGDHLFVGAVGDDEASSDAGAVYVFGRNQGGTNNWGLVKKLTAPFGATNDQFGAHIDADAQHAIVGATGDDQYGDNAGAAYIFGRNTGGANNWGLVIKLLAGDGDGADNFGSDVAISGDFALVGADQQDDKGTNAGKVYAYYRNQWNQQNSWGQLQGILDANGQPGDNFGAAVAMENEYAVIGAPGADVQPFGQDAGKAIVYQRQQAGWVPVDQLYDAPGHTGDRFGMTVAIGDRAILIGAPLDDQGTQLDRGSITFFEGVCTGGESRENVEEVLATTEQTIKAFPVPFSDRLTIRVAGYAAARITMINSLGQEVAVVHDGALPAEGAQLQWDARRFEPGMYFIRVQSANGVQTKAVTLAR